MISSLKFKYPDNLSVINTFFTGALHWSQPLRIPSQWGSLVYDNDWVKKNLTTAELKSYVSLGLMDLYY